MATVGIDVGSLTTKAVIFNENKILGYSIISPAEGEEVIADILARQALENALVNAGINEADLTGILVTGVSRKEVEFIPRQKSSLVCLAKGAHFLSPEVRTLMDVGAETSTIVRISAKGGVEDSAFNDRCAAGTGVYVDTMARLMHMSTEEMARASLSGKQRAEVSSMCAVFAEQEVISHIHRDPPTPQNDVIKGILGSIAMRIVGIAKRVGIKPEVMMSGGMAKNVGFVHEVEEEIKLKLLLPDEPQLVGALGAALLAA